MSLTDGFTLEDQPGLFDAGPRMAGAVLQDRFVVPPLSVLDRRQGYWMDRQRQWGLLGIKSELGRAAGLTYGKFDNPDFKGTSEQVLTQTSIFDPVVCELTCRWFCPPGGRVLDPFAGGAVRGVVAGATGRHYVGIDLSEAQVDANREQASRIFGGGVDFGRATHVPRWKLGDAREVAPHATAESYDLVFTCPPYAGLERYSDHAADLSNMDYPKFLAAYRDIIAAGWRALRPDRFATIVIGDARGPDGHYHNLVGDTITAYLDAGFGLYGQAVIVDPVGTAQIRVGKQFVQSRKIALTHQHYLLFVKGDPRVATEAIGQDPSLEMAA
jgi:DNA modification methylase